MIGCACGGWLEPMVASLAFSLAAVVAWLRVKFGGSK